MTACTTVAAMGLILSGRASLAAEEGSGQALITGAGWNVTGGEQGLEIRWGRQLVTTYCTTQGRKPYFYPVIGPTGEALTRGFPMDPQPDEPQDHPHHRSLFFGHRNVNGIDFWSAELHSEKSKSTGLQAGEVRQVAMSGMEVGKDGVKLRVRNDWLEEKKAKVCEDSRVYRVSRLDNGDFLLDWDLTLLASETDITFGDDKDGTMAIRFIPGLQLKAHKGSTQPATGHILNSEGIMDAEAWGKRAKWVAYSGLDRKGNPVSVAIFDHAQNLRHPTWWHARDYGLCAANPFGIHHFEKKEEHAGAYTVKKGESLRFRYRLLFQGGAADAGSLEARWQAWVKEP